MWYFDKVAKVPKEKDDMCYAHGGQCVHKTLEDYYNGKLLSIEEIDKKFDSLWIEKYKLHEHKTFKDKKDEYRDMVTNGINLGLSVTNNELKIFYPDYVVYIDVVNTKTDEIGDWKSSTRKPEKDIEYKQQGMVYAWAYFRKFGRLPKKVTFYYLKYKTPKKILFEFIPTSEDIVTTQKWYNDIMNQMIEIKNTKKVPPMVKVCDEYCKFSSICPGYNKTGKVFNIEYLGNDIRISGPINEVINNVFHNVFSYELKNAFWIKKNKCYCRYTERYIRRLFVGYY